MHLSVVLLCSSAVSVIAQSRPINYTEIDCLGLTLGADFLFGVLAESLPPPKMEFQLFTRNNPFYSQSLVMNNESSVCNSNFKAEACTKFLIHGYQSSAEQGFYLDLRTALLAREDCNIITTNWEDGASKFYFPGAIINAYRTGKYTAAMIKFLQETTGITLDKIHVIGFSLGAQVASFTGKRLDKLARISGRYWINTIDPAGVCFDSLPPKYRLNTTDANFVDLLITTAGTIAMANPIGHVNVFLNGGEFQPGCSREVVQNVGNDVFQAYSVIFDNCSHARAMEVYIETTLNPSYRPWAYLCDDYDTFENGECTDCGDDGSKCALAGIEADEYVRYLGDNTDGGKVFYLDTALSSPFGVYHYQVMIKIASNRSVEQYGKVMASFSGNKAKHFKTVFRRLELFKPGGTYRYLLKSNYDILPVTNVSLFWFFYPIIDAKPKSPGLFISSLQLKPMVRVSRNHNDSVYSFCGNENQIIPPGVTTILFPC